MIVLFPALDASADNRQSFRLTFRFCNQFVVRLLFVKSVLFCKFQNNCKSGEHLHGGLWITKEIGKFNISREIIYISRGEVEEVLSYHSP